jgi:midasin (ATPase involved in ribosome maturation)
MEKPLGMKFREKEEGGEEGEEGDDKMDEGEGDDVSMDDQDNNLPDNMEIDGDEQGKGSDQEDNNEMDSDSEKDEMKDGEQDQDQMPEDDPKDDEKDENDGMKAVGSQGGNLPENEDQENPEMDPEPEAMEVADQQGDDNNKNKPPVHGVHSLNGKDSILNPPEEEEKKQRGDSSTLPKNDHDQSTGGGSTNKNDGQGDSGDLTTNVGNNDSDPSAPKDSQQKKNRQDPPNPFMNKGDIEKKWFRRLNMVENDDDAGGNLNEKEDDEEASDGNDEDRENNANHKPPKSQYEFSDNKKDQNTEQVLGNVDKNDAVQLPESGEIQPDEEDADKAMDVDEEKAAEEQNNKRSRQEDQEDDDKQTSAPQTKRKRSEKLEPKGDTKLNQGNEQAMEESEDEVDQMPSDADDLDDEGISQEDDQEGGEQKKPNEVKPIHTNREFQFSENSNFESLEAVEDELEDLKIESNKIVGDTSGARVKWQQHRMATEAHAIRLAEQLRLILEPTLATRLQGDYRTGKRINMRKVISYIASGFRKDKIWLRRTKPAKRDYQVMLLIDDSKSMGAAGKLALSSLALLSTAMTRLEIGELCVASFAENVNILHSFGVPFTEDSGAQIVSQFGFNANYTRLGESLQSIVPIFSQARDSLSSSNDSAILQLCFVISDARIDSDNRAKLESTIRKMSEQHILVVLVIIDCNENPRDSIFNTKSVSFVGDKVVTKSYFDSFPFPYYVAIQNLQALPEVLADALKQWFELIKLQMNN